MCHLVVCKAMSFWGVILSIIQHVFLNLKLRNLTLLLSLQTNYVGRISMTLKLEIQAMHLMPNYPISVLKSSRLWVDDAFIFIGWNEYRKYCNVTGPCGEKTCFFTTACACHGTLCGLRTSLDL